MPLTLNAGEAAKALREGYIGLIPTETVVGLVGAVGSLGRLQRVKGRGEEKPVPLVFSSVREALSLSPVVPEVAWRLAREFWPGPLTLVLDAGDGSTVGVRVPGECALREVLLRYEGTLGATSANISGDPAPARLDEVDPRVLSAVDFRVDGAPGGGEASAVVDLSAGKVRLLRPAGRLSEDYLRRIGSKRDINKTEN